MAATPHPSETAEDTQDVYSSPNKVSLALCAVECLNCVLVEAGGVYSTANSQVNSLLSAVEC